MIWKGKQHFNELGRISKYNIYIHPNRFCSTNMEEKNMHLWPKHANDRVTEISKHKLLDVGPQVLGME